MANMELKPAGVGAAGSKLVDTERPMPARAGVVIERGPTVVDHRHKFQKKVGGATLALSSTDDLDQRRDELLNVHIAFMSSQAKVPDSYERHGKNHSRLQEEKTQPWSWPESVQEISANTKGNYGNYRNEPKRNHVSSNWNSQSSANVPRPKEQGYGQVRD